jgi:excisionase family DNA binding protein
MSAKVRHLVPLSEQQGDSSNWPAEFKQIIGMLIDLVARTLSLSANGQMLTLNEVLTADELAAKLKIPASTIEELARRKKLKGSFRIGKHWRFDLDVLRTTLPIGENDDS